MDDLQKSQEHQLAEYDSCYKSDDNAYNRYYQSLNGQHPGNMPLAHSQYIVDADFLFPSLDEETVGIEQEDYGKYNDDYRRPGKAEPQIPVSHALISGQGVYDIEHHDRKDRRQHIRNIGFPVILQVGDRKFSIN